MELGTNTLLTCFVLCVAFITMSTQAPAAIKDHLFPILTTRVNDTLGCYKEAKGFPGAPYKGRLSQVIGLAPNDVDTWQGKDKHSRYSLCLSALKGFQDPLSTVIATEKDQPDFTCAGLLPKLSEKLKKLSGRLIDTIHALERYQPDIKLSGVKSLDMIEVLKEAAKSAKTWPRPAGTNPQFLANYVILDQLKDTVQSFRQHNVCPVPFE